MRSLFFISIILQGQFLFCQPADTLIPFEDGKKWGYISTKKKIIIPASYDIASPFENEFAQVCRDEKCGIIDKNNKIIIPFDKQFCFQATNDLFITVRPKDEDEDTKSGVITSGNKILIPFEYDNIELENGVFSLYKDSKYGIADLNGKTMIEPNYNFIRYAGNDRYVVTNNNLQALFDLKGNQLTEFKYMVIDNFRSHLAKARVGDLFGFLDRQGHEFIPFIYEMVYPFSDGYAVIKKDRKYGLVDTLGTITILPTYDEMNDIHLGVASVKMGNKWALVDQKGKAITGSEFDEIKRAYNGVITVKKEKKWAIMNPKGQLLTAFEFDTIKIYEGGEDGVRSFGVKDQETDPGYLLVSTSDKWGVADMTGKIIIPPQYDDVHPFTHGVALVKKNGKHAVIDTKGKIRTKFIYDDLDSYIAGAHHLKRYGIILFYRDRLVGIMDTSGKEITSPYENISPADDNFYRVIKNKKVGVIDSKGKVILKPEYNGIKTQPIRFSFDDVIFKNGFCIAMKGDRIVYVDKKGKEYFK